MRPPPRSSNRRWNSRRGEPQHPAITFCFPWFRTFTAESWEHPPGASPTGSREAGVILTLTPIGGGQQSSANHTTTGTLK